MHCRKILAEESDNFKKFSRFGKTQHFDLDNAEAKQQIIIRIYDTLKLPSPRMVERLGIVYTPVEVVDFIIHSVNDVLKQEFGRSISKQKIFMCSIPLQVRVHLLPDCCKADSFNKKT